MWERRLIGYSKIDGGWGDTPTYVGKTIMLTSSIYALVIETLPRMWERHQRNPLFCWVLFLKPHFGIYLIIFYIKLDYMSKSKIRVFVSIY